MWKEKGSHLRLAMATPTSAAKPAPNTAAAPPATAIPINPSVNNSQSFWQQKITQENMLLIDKIDNHCGIVTLIIKTGNRCGITTPIIRTGSHCGITTPIIRTGSYCSITTSSIRVVIDQCGIITLNPWSHRCSTTTSIKRAYYESEKMYKKLEITPDLLLADISYYQLGVMIAIMKNVQQKIKI